MQILIQDTQCYLTISDGVFNKKFNPTLIHQITNAFLAGSRQGSCTQKSRAEVSGSGKKPWRQKGTGRARVGSIRSPIWRSGGVTFANKPRSYIQKVNKKMYRGALKSIFSTLIQQERLIVFKDFTISHPKTKCLLEKMKSISLNAACILLDKIDKNLFLASRNLHKICVKQVYKIDPISLIHFKYVITTVEAIKRIEVMLR